LVISVPLASLIWFGMGASHWPFWQPTLLLLGIGLLGSVTITLLTPAESPSVLRRFYLQIRPPGRWGPVRNALAAEGLIDLNQQRREFKWDLLAAACGIVFCFSMTYAYFLCVLLHWRSAAVFGVATVAFGLAFFVCWLRSARIAVFAETTEPVNCVAPVGAS